MVKFLPNWQGQTFEEYVKGPKSTLSGVKKDRLLSDPLIAQKLPELWLSRTGRCTSFWLKIVPVLDEQLPNSFDLKTFDVSQHRLSRCEETSLLADSGSRRGPLKLPDTGVWDTTELDKPEWQYHEGTCNYRKKEDPNHPPGVPVNEASARPMEIIQRDE
ncbi:hypothetical protein N0V84_006973 [Fusarium piperis]|uniref:Uncharacterized protein n=1 Tax=Fusarium piperis TaxID=1435070 RepID=A0A9W8WAV0_9HYPO|nr:hypothetical protein N0V84_006973 [Fusarium piperis]